MTVPAGAGFEVDGRTARGEIESDFGDSLEIHMEKQMGTVRGQVGSGPKLTLNTERGKLAIRKN